MRVAALDAVAGALFLKVGKYVQFSRLQTAFIVVAPTIPQKR